MSSLYMVGPRRKVFELRAQQNDCALLIKQFDREEKIRSAAKVAAGALILGLVCWSFVTSLEREDKRMDIELQNLQAQGYPVPK